MSFTTTTLHQGQPDYPSRLRGLRDAPVRLHVQGALLEPLRSVAIVGTRSASGHGTAAARALAAELAAAGYAVISGGALGIDAAAHRGALDAAGVTVAVLASGLDAPYPSRNHPLFNAMCERAGCLVTPFEQGVPPRRWHFVRRNRIIAGLADAVLVIEAGHASGAHYTAAAAREYGRVLGALPGSPGTEALIAQGAAVVSCAADLAAALAGRPRRPSVPLPEPGSEEACVLAALEPAAAHGQDELAASTGLGARAVARALTGLELEGLAVPLPGNIYIRSTLAGELLAR